MRFAQFAPARVAGLMLLDTRAGAEPPMSRLKYRLMARIYRRFGLIQAIDDQVMALMFGRDFLRDRPDVVEIHRQRILEHDPAQIFQAVRAVANRRDFSPALPALNTPTLVLVGDQDLATPPNCSRRLKQLIPGACLEIVGGAGHLSVVEMPDVVLDHIVSFLDRVYA